MRILDYQYLTLTSRLFLHQLPCLYVGKKGCSQGVLLQFVFRILFEDMISQETRGSDCAKVSSSSILFKQLPDFSMPVKWKSFARP
ncbi:MAG: hypothetical protein ACPL1K_03120, partial [Candidatus Kryptoniota bacterium]